MRTVREKLVLEYLKTLDRDERKRSQGWTFEEAASLGNSPSLKREKDLL